MAGQQRSPIRRSTGSRSRAVRAGLQGGVQAVAVAAGGQRPGDQAGPSVRAGAQARPGRRSAGAARAAAGPPPHGPARRCRGPGHGRADAPGSRTPARAANRWRECRGRVPTVPQPGQHDVQRPQPPSSFRPAPGMIFSRLTRPARSVTQKAQRDSPPLADASWIKSSPACSRSSWPSCSASTSSRPPGIPVGCTRQVSPRPAAGHSRHSSSTTRPTLPN